MEIIAEKINGTRARVLEAIKQRDAAYIRDLARRQAEAGSHWLDVNAGTHPSQEGEDLVWLIEQVQAVTDVPLCIDSANPEAISMAVRELNKTPMINSISGEPKRLEGILPIVAEYNCKVIVLAMDSNTIPKDCAGRMAIINNVMAETRAARVPDSDVYVDPLLMTIATDVQSTLVVLEIMREVRRSYPEAHLTVGLSNVSFGLPSRSYINRTFVPLAMQAGLDSVILDPLDTEVRAAILAADVLLGQDKHCLNYLRAARQGVLA